VRARLESLAKEKGIDFLIAENWYNIPHQEFSKDLVWEDLRNKKEETVNRKIKSKKKKKEEK
jgi:hypothetical protein